MLIGQRHFRPEYQLDAPASRLTVWDIYSHTKANTNKMSRVWHGFVLGICLCTGHLPVSRLATSTALLRQIEGKGSSYQELDPKKAGIRRDPPRAVRAKRVKRFRPTLPQLRCAC